MPYSVPTPPKVNSPAKETPPTRSPIPHSKKGFCTPPTHVENIENSSSGIHGPMPGIPRRASSRNTSPVMSRSASSTHQSFSAVQPTIDGLPRRGSHNTIPSTPTSGLPQHVGSLGLKLHPSPTTAPSISRVPQDSLDSTSSLDSSLPPTPRDDPLELHTMSSATPAVEKSSVPFPEFESTPRPSSSTHPLRNGTTSSRRPSLIRQHSASTSGHNRGGGSLQLQIAGSASTSELVPSPADYRPTRPTSMIRKKSGEVVKPSLKQRSMSTPDLTRLKEDQEPDEEDAPTSRPFGGERSKSVRFAGADSSEPGSALESIVSYVVGSRPISVSANKDGGEYLTETETEADTDASDFVHFRTRKNELAKAHDDAREIALEGGSRIPRVRCDFAPHALDGEMVVMERADLTTVHGALCIQGTIIVRNVAFQKWVAVRFTMDHWQTTSEVSGNHVTHVSSSTTHDEGWDRFSFTIKLEDYKRKLEEKQLMICIRFSVEGREWWDSNNGLNYQFNFKRSSPRRSRHSLPPSKRIASDFAHEYSLPGLRQGGFTPSSRIAHQFGVGTPKPSSSDGARDWNFPVLGRGQGSGANSPALSPPPAAAYRAPPPPDVHTHLTLKNHCAPSPPKTSAPLPPTASTSQSSSEIVESSASAATSASASTSKASPGHDRSSSWAGKSESWDSFSKVLKEDPDNYASTDGSSTPLATGSGSASVEDMASQSATPPRRGLTMKRSTNDLQALRNGGGGLTPPSSHDSSPSPLQHTVALPQTTDSEGAPPMSPDPSDPSLNSTGDSSPLDTVPNDSTADLANLNTSDPNTSSAHRLLNDASYQEFISKFCFFQSPNRVVEELPPVRKTYSHVSGHASPAGFPFYGHQGSSSQQSSTLSSSSSLSTGSASSSLSTSNNDNTTPRQEYDSATDAFSMPHRPESLTPRAMSRQNSD